MKILAATDFSTRSQRALRRAGVLARDLSAELTLVHVVDDDQPSDLLELERREAQRYLEEQMVSIAELQGLRCSSEVVAGDPFDGILKAAEERSIDLIVMGSHRKQLLRDIFVGTTIERVIRTAACPVLMVNAEVEHSYKKVLAAVDMSQPSARAIRTAREIGLTGDASLSLVHGFDAFAKGKMSNAGLGKDEIARYVATERLQVGTELVAFLEANDVGIDNWSLRIKEAGPVEAIMEEISQVAPDLLIIGTHGRTGLIKVLLGSVTESILRSVDIDVFAVPPVRE
ncbi:universal stress protein [Mesorhizobium sp. ESP7-2]|uniref:universal stress protein n=1 Tax=Mesorhizobium sp. ESP7-2 TaxID=2876622 RepID=UPI001CCFE14D|nr:universal stress protein [Mesorhizobium sp. ESP7-2]MBZ9708539.1 universal stress protein [Mesorhizobium sp. ESP7-2]